ncbi:MULTISPECIES: asparaginase [unclassified Modicisalibacter]|uniref:asparaginase n=1 Tax=unclassified Modicisalibacter TaxID=2679913 RepID=UPI001CCB293B|nr:MULTISPECIES: asparaginase [unclassified Modicisalibacter]MBZ9556965.1 asparaginase [Modicisalibacter sp. R2A 31.J]MBZ9574321.1 asparaginase [Modicisalibacter sp. MOD 31.J]
MTEAPLLILYTGGTFGMIESPRGLVPGGDIARRIQQALTGLPPARQASLPSFEVREAATPIDSSAATPLDWQRLARELANAYAEQRYAGFVVIHGTDTLAWTASSLAYQLQGIDRPVVVTGSQKPLEAEDSDALANLEAALRFAALPALQEVAVCFAGKLLRGVRTRKWDTHATNGFASPNYPLLGEMVAGQAILYAARGLDDQQRGLPRFELTNDGGSRESPVARIALWPGLSTRLLERWLLDDDIHAGLLEVWGSGNIPDDPALLEVLARASGEGKLLAAISQCPHGPVAIGTYAAGQGLLDAGVMSGDAMTPEAAITKLVHLLAQPLSEAERRQRFLTSLVGER